MFAAKVGVKRARIKQGEIMLSLRLQQFLLRKRTLKYKYRKPEGIYFERFRGSCSSSRSNGLVGRKLRACTSSKSLEAYTRGIEETDQTEMIARNSLLPRPPSQHNTFGGDLRKGTISTHPAEREVRANNSYVNARPPRTPDTGAALEAIRR